MDNDHWLVGWPDIGKYLGKSTKTAQRYARSGMPFFRDPGGLPMAKPSMIDDYIVEINQGKHDDKIWKDKGIKAALAYEDYDEKQRKDFDERFLAVQKPPRSQY